MKKYYCIAFILTFVITSHFAFSQTENDPIQSEQIENNIPLYRETEHLRLYLTSEDSAIAEKLLSLLESNFLTMASDLKHYGNKKIDVMIFPNLCSFHHHIGWEVAPDWCVLNTNRNKIEAVSPLRSGSYWDHDAMFGMIARGMARSIVLDKVFTHNNYVPPWFIHGMAIYEIRNLPIFQKSIERFKNHLTYIVQQKDLPSLSYDFQKGPLSVCYSVATFFIEEFGFDAALTILEDFSAFKEATGLSISEFQKRWHDYLRKEYQPPQD